MSIYFQQVFSRYILFHFALSVHLSNINRKSTHSKDIIYKIKKTFIPFSFWRDLDHNPSELYKIYPNLKYGVICRFLAQNGININFEFINIVPNGMMMIFCKNFYFRIVRFLLFFKFMITDRITTELCHFMSCSANPLKK